MFAPPILSGKQAQMLQKLPRDTFAWPNTGRQSVAFVVIGQDVGSTM